MALEPAAGVLTRYQERLWQIEVEVAGRACRFLFDLGAGVTSLDARVADELGLREVGRVTGTRMTGARLEIGMLEPAPLALAGRSFGARSLGRADFTRLLPPGWPAIDGVLALDALAETPFTVDFARDTFALGPPASPEGLRALTVRLHRQIPAVSLVVLVAVEGPEGGLWFELDNSNVGPVLVSPAAAVRLGIPPAAGPATFALRVRGLGAVEGPVAVRELIYDGNLGVTFATPRRFAFDLARGRVLAGASLPTG